jgi:1-acyl-sn-glycerol-3-phosphate acyltransferase
VLSFQTILMLLLVWSSLIVIGRAAERSPRDGGDWTLAWLVVCIYARLFHRVRFEGAENIPRWTRGDPAPGPLVVVSNHTAGVDPLLIHAACPFDIRWMMMREMMLTPLARLWTWLEIIPVDQNGRDSTSLRTAIRHLQSGAVIGIFAEGGIERPREHINPYLPGIGLLVLKGKARVLPVVIRGTPPVSSAYKSLLLPSRSIVKFLPVRTFTKDSTPAEIALSLEKQAATTLGWARHAKDLATPGHK